MEFKGVSRGLLNFTGCCESPNRNRGNVSMFDVVPREWSKSTRFDYSPSENYQSTGNSVRAVRECKFYYYRGYLAASRGWLCIVLSLLLLNNATFPSINSVRSFLMDFFCSREWWDEIVFLFQFLLIITIPRRWIETTITDFIWRLSQRRIYRLQASCLSLFRLFLLMSWSLDSSSLFSSTIFLFPTDKCSSFFRLIPT